jgi:chitobiase/beta-hexosaminidase-like protein/F5/8 type C domain-containing protein
VAEGPALAAERVTLRLVAADPGDAIHYTLDGRLPDEESPRYAAPLSVEAPGAVTFRARRGSDWSPLVTAPVGRLDPRRRIAVKSPINPQYTGGGDQALVDGILGRLDFRLGGWQGFEGVDLQAEVDLGEEREVRRVSTGFLHDPNSWIFLPLEVRYAVSADGRTWTPAGTVTTGVDPRREEPLRQEFSLTLAPTRARYLRLETASRLRCPDWHKGAGGKAHLFADEIVVE